MPHHLLSLLTIFNDVISVDDILLIEFTISFIILISQDAKLKPNRYPLPLILIGSTAKQKKKKPGISTIRLPGCGTVILSPDSNILEETDIDINPTAWRNITIRIRSLL